MLTPHCQESQRHKKHNYLNPKDQTKGPSMQQTHWEPDQKEKRGGNPLNPKILTPLNPASHRGSLPVKRSHLSNLLQH